VDIGVKSNSDGMAIFDSVDRIGPTKCEEFGTGNFSLTNPARPAAPKCAIENSMFTSSRGLTYSDYSISAESRSKTKKSSNVKRKE
jgi:hypothetical protein